MSKLCRLHFTSQSVQIHNFSVENGLPRNWPWSPVSHPRINHLSCILNFRNLKPSCWPDLPLYPYCVWDLPTVNASSKAAAFLEKSSQEQRLQELNFDWGRARGEPKYLRFWVVSSSNGKSDGGTAITSGKKWSLPHRFWKCFFVKIETHHTFKGQVSVSGC